MEQKENKLRIFKDNNIGTFFCYMLFQTSSGY